MNMTARQRIGVTFADGLRREYDAPLPVSDILPAPADAAGLPYIGAVVNNEVVSFSFPLEVDSEIRLLTAADEAGWRIHALSVCFLLSEAARHLYPAASFRIEHSLGTGFYCTLEFTGGAALTPAHLAALEARMRALVAQNLPIERRKMRFADAIQQFEAEGREDKAKLLRYHNPPKVVTYRCGDFVDLAHSVLADRTGPLGVFALVPYGPGFVVQFPDRAQPCRPAAFVEQPHLFAIFQERKNWGRVLNVDDVGQLNEIVAAREISDFIRIAEALHEKKIAQIADRICADTRRRWVLIAGPSSSGKTTFAKRLAVQLRVNGRRPLTLSTDDYFVDRDRTPSGADGKPDFENLEAIDLPLLHEQLLRLDRGEEIEQVRFDFEKGVRAPTGQRLRIEADQLVIMEGTHALNPRLTDSVPEAHKFRVYVSALTQLNLDHNNRISTTDNRLVRRLVRDHQFRGHSALTTLDMWAGVRRGEQRWIFPFQGGVDIAFNSALDYELAVLRPLAEPLLAEVKPFHAQYAEARRLMAFLREFLAAPYHLVPPTSILREFIGHSSFKY